MDPDGRNHLRDPVEGGSHEEERPEPNAPVGAGETAGEAILREAYALRDAARIREIGRRIVAMRVVAIGQGVVLLPLVYVAFFRPLLRMMEDGFWSPRLVVTMLVAAVFVVATGLFCWRMIRDEIEDLQWEREDLETGGAGIWTTSDQRPRRLRVSAGTSERPGRDAADGSLR